MDKKKKMLPQNWAEYFVQSDVMSVTGISDLILVIVSHWGFYTPVPVLMKSIVTIYVIGFTSYPCYRTSDMWCSTAYANYTFMVGHLWSFRCIKGEKQWSFNWQK